MLRLLLGCLTVAMAILPTVGAIRMVTWPDILSAAATALALISLAIQLTNSRVAAYAACATLAGLCLLWLGSGSVTLLAMIAIVAAAVRASATATAITVVTVLFALYAGALSVFVGITKDFLSLPERAEIMRDHVWPMAWAAFAAVASLGLIAAGAVRNGDTPKEAGVR